MTKFRNRMRENGLLEAVTGEIERQLTARGVQVREGHIKIVDATLVPAAVQAPPKADQGGKQQPPLDPDAAWTVKNGEPVYGYKLHMAQDRETGLITGHVVTPANVHDSRVFEELLDQREGEVLTDKAYDSRDNRAACGAGGAKASIQKRADSKGRISQWWKGRNRNIGRVRGFIEGSFAALKRYLGCGRARYRGLARVNEQLTWGVTAFNLRRAVALLHGQPVRRKPKRREKRAFAAGRSCTLAA
jgi:IS5 family transposase